MKHIIIVGVLLFSTFIPGKSQKVKYKDLFILLKAENYSDGDRYLRAFLKEEPDHPSANYYMGRMLQSYLEDQDLVNNEDRIVELADSSVKYLNNALSLTTEKYVKKVFKVIFIGILIIILIGLFGYVTMRLWNWLMPVIFNLPEVTALQMTGLITLSIILFKSPTSKK